MAILQFHFKCNTIILSSIKVHGLLVTVCQDTGTQIQLTLTFLFLSYIIQTKCEIKQRHLT
jgi:hypothetical protein